MYKSKFKFAKLSRDFLSNFSTKKKHQKSRKDDNLEDVSSNSTDRNSKIVRRFTQP